MISTLNIHSGGRTRSHVDTHDFEPHGDMNDKECCVVNMSCQCHIYIMPPSIKETNRTNRCMTSCSEKQLNLPFTLQLITLPQTFLHSLLHQSSCRTRHLKLSLSNLYIAETQYTRAIKGSLARRLSVAVVIVVVVVVAEGRLRPDWRRADEAITGGKQSSQ